MFYVYKAEPKDDNPSDYFITRNLRKYINSKPDYFNSVNIQYKAEYDTRIQAENAIINFKYDDNYKIEKYKRTTSTFTKNYEIGKRNEGDVLFFLNNFIKGDGIIYQTTQKLGRYDYYGDNYIYELKTRNFVKDKYATTFIPTKKLLSDNLFLIIGFLIDDKNPDLYKYFYIIYNKELFNTYKITNIKPMNSLINETVIHIKISDLQPLNKQILLTPLITSETANNHIRLLNQPER